VGKAQELARVMAEAREAPRRQAGTRHQFELSQQITADSRTAGLFHAFG